MPQILERKPLLTFLRERETLIPRQKLVDMFGATVFEQQLPLDKVKPEEAIEIVANTSWARGLAEGLCALGAVPGLPA